MTLRKWLAWTSFFIFLQTFHFATHQSSSQSVSFECFKQHCDKTSVSSVSVVPIFFFFENKCGLSWLQKGTKTRLRCITSLDSVQQLRRVLLCVRLFHEQLWLKPQWFSLNSDWWVGGGDGNVISWTMFDLTKLRWIATIHTTKDSRPPAKLTPMYYFVKQITSH